MNLRSFLGSIGANVIGRGEKRFAGNLAAELGIRLPAESGTQAPRPNVKDPNTCQTKKQN